MGWQDLTEGGIREPGLLEWPGMIKRNVHTLYPAGTVDLKPTVLDILGITPPAGWPLDGTSLLPLIEGRATERAKPMGWVWGMVYGNRNRTGVSLAAPLKKSLFLLASPLPSIGRQG